MWEHVRHKIEYRHKHQLGHWVWILCRAKVVKVDENGNAVRIVGTDTNVSSLRQRDTDMAQLANKLELAIGVSGIGIWEYDPISNSVHWDNRMLQIYGLTDGRNDRGGEIWETYLHPDDLEDTIAYSDHCQKHGLDFCRDYRIVRPDGAVRHIRSHAGIVAASKSHGKLIGLNIDVTDDYERSAQLEQAKAQLEYDSRHDALTGLANRRLLDERTDAFFAQVSDGDAYAVMQLDLDHFKQINDTLGHAAGDAVLVHVAQVLDSIVAKSGLTCRVGGDEFVILMENIDSREALEGTCRAILKAMAQPFFYDGHHCAFGASIGLAAGKGRPKTRGEIFIHADTALYAAKQAGRGCYQIYSDVMEATIDAKACARQRLVDALARQELVCHFQPQFDPSGQQIVGAEALVRWQCPKQGLLEPDAFIPIAQELGLVEQIDAWIFEYVLQLQTRWHAAGRAYPPIAINMSARRFADSSLLDDMRDMVKPHHALCVELLETAFLDTLSDQQIRRLEDLRKLGVGVDLDDFGSGYASLAAMQSVRPDRIKVSQTLVDPIVAQPKQIKFLQLLSQLARLQGVGIVIEGVDTLAHLRAIKDIDCDVLQGFALGRPVSTDGFEGMLGEFT